MHKKIDLMSVYFDIQLKPNHVCVNQLFFILIKALNVADLDILDDLVCIEESNGSFRVKVENCEKNKNILSYSSKIINNVNNHEEIEYFRIFQE